jgi:hypothetical protein
MLTMTNDNTSPSDSELKNNVSVVGSAASNLSSVSSKNAKSII